ncbi:MAG: hypothetical protein ACTSQN_08220 [Candidatus Heimdallarchaeota archaeon]
MNQKEIDTTSSIAKVYDIIAESFDSTRKFQQENILGKKFPNS